MWPNPEQTRDLVTFTEEMLNGKLHFLCSTKIISVQSISKSTYLNELNSAGRCVGAINLVLTTE